MLISAGDVAAETPAVLLLLELIAVDWITKEVGEIRKQIEVVIDRIGVGAGDDIAIARLILQVQAVAL